VLLLLPPSETKRDGGANGSSLSLDALSFASLADPREVALAALTELMADVTVAARALGLGPTQGHELERNRVVRTSAVMPAIERYTGVLYDALEVATLDADARGFAQAHVAIHSALFGLVAANDPIPAYRMSHNTRLVGPSLSAIWKRPIERALTEHGGFIVDVRSGSYARLGPAPAGSTVVRVVTRGADGSKEALSHVNKKAKGEFTRAVLKAGIAHDSPRSLISWARGEGITLEAVHEGVVELVV
jgi:uncharacterized protein